VEKLIGQIGIKYKPRITFDIAYNEESNDDEGSYYFVESFKLVRN
jgi:hypothetical protein